MFDCIVVGSGTAGVAATLGLSPKKVLMLDVGYQPKSKSLPDQDILQLKSSGESFDEIIGPEFESLEHFDVGYLSPKLKGPLMRFILEAPKAVKGLDTFENFHSHISYAKGGLANAWGAGVMRYSEQELSEFPIELSELETFYNQLTAKIGISGADDDLKDHFGSLEFILPPLPYSPIAERFHNNYEKSKSSWQKKGFLVGRPRLAVLSQALGGRPAYRFFNQDFFQPHNPSVFHPSLILDELIESGQVDYRSGYLAKSFKEKSSGIVELRALNIASNTEEVFQTKMLILAAGTINTSRIVLHSYDDKKSKLPLLDNPIQFVPFVDLGLIGKEYRSDVFPGAELCIVHKQGEAIDFQASVYGLTGPLRGDLISEFPLSITSNIFLAKTLGPALGMAQVFFPDSPQEGNFLQLNSKGGISIQYENIKTHSTTKLIRLLQKAGYLTSSFLTKEPLPGSSIHYAGSLPMSNDSNKAYSTDKFCRLNHTSRVFIVDGSVFPTLPAKNHTFTIMANAMRVGEHLKNVQL